MAGSLSFQPTRIKTRAAEEQDASARHPYNHDCKKTFLEAPSASDDEIVGVEMILAEV
jgi:hypothetical protein